MAVANTCAVCGGFFFLFKQKTAYELRIGDWSSDVCSSDLKDDEDTDAVDFSGHTPVGECPKCHHKVYEHGMNYVCEKSVGPDKTCDSIGRASSRERVCQSV